MVRYAPLLSMYFFMVFWKMSCLLKCVGPPVLCSTACAVARTKTINGSTGEISRCYSTVGGVKAELRIRDVFSESEFFPSRIRIKKSSILTKKLFLSSRKYDPGCSSRIRIFNPSRIPDPGVNKALDPGSGSATLGEGTVPDNVWKTCE